MELVRWEEGTGRGMAVRMRVTSMGVKDHQPIAK